MDFGEDSCFRLESRDLDRLRTQLELSWSSSNLSREPLSQQCDGEDSTDRLVIEYDDDRCLEENVVLFRLEKRRLDLPLECCLSWNSCDSSRRPRGDFVECDGERLLLLPNLSDVTASSEFPLCSQSSITPGPDLDRVCDVCLVVSGGRLGDGDSDRDRCPRDDLAECDVPLFRSCSRSEALDETEQLGECESSLWHM